jgi:hypothetical protein
MLRALSKRWRLPQSLPLRMIGSTQPLIARSLISSGMQGVARRSALRQASSNAWPLALARKA